MGNNININSFFDSGNIRVIEADEASNIKLEINKDTHSDFYQWFHYRLQSTANVEHQMTITNAAGAAYVEGWDDYQAVASYDRSTWFRVDTDYQNGELVITHTPQQDSIYYAYFAPYCYERHLDLLQRVQQSELCKLEHLGETVEGRDMTVVVINGMNDDSDSKSESKKKAIWIIGRQHPGEAMAEWFIEGVLDRLLDEDDPLSRKLLETCTFYVVPNMNPDGSVLGNLRSNAAGANLNREWLEPSATTSPEVYLVRKKMLETSVDMFLDIHGDEAIPYNFLAGCEGIPSFDEKHEQIQNYFAESFLKTSPDFQTKHGYPKESAGSANLTIACNWVGEEFKCLSYTLEMPFKDNNDLPDAAFGWSPERCYRLGESILQPVYASVTQFK